jgi:hypothetical protein
VRPRALPLAIAAQQHRQEIIERLVLVGAVAPFLTAEHRCNFKPERLDSRDG